MPHLLLSFIITPQSRHLQYAGISTTVEAAPSSVTSWLLFSIFNPATWYQASPVLLDPVNTSAVMLPKPVPTGRLLHIIKFGCRLEEQPYLSCPTPDHGFCVLTLRKHVPEDFTAVMPALPVTAFIVTVKQESHSQTLGSDISQTALIEFLFPLEFYKPDLPHLHFFQQYLPGSHLETHH
ncbi:hypothetical protein STEG23_000501 [Scotinomys teguina]